MKFIFANKNLNRIYFAILCVTVLAFMPFSGNAQTKGVIYKRAVPISPATTTPLDPDGNGYTSVSTSGFTSGDITAGETELVFKSIPQLEQEPTSDLGPGPDCSFTDMVDLSTEYRSVGMMIDGSNNYIFRFRLGGSAPNSKGYSILIDTDNKFGFSGTSADPNATSGNPGFEMEIILATNFGVRLYDVDGIGGNGAPLLKTELSYTNYAQKSVAYTTQCGDADYFYDFYMPLSVIQTYFPSFNLNTQIRVVANTIIAPQSAIKGPISDLGGVDDRKYSDNATAAWSALMDIIPATSSTTIGSSGFPVRSEAPTVLGPITTTLATGNSSITVSFTTTETSGYLYIYKNAVKVDSIAITAAGTYNKSVSLAYNDAVTAYVKASGEALSLVSNTKYVSLTCTAAPVITATTTNQRGLTGTAVAGSTIQIYSNGVLLNNATTYPGINSIVADVSGTWTFNFCAQGQFCLPCGTLWATATGSGQCESGISNVWCNSSTQGQSSCGTYGAQTDIPTVSTSTLFTTTTSISGTVPGTSSGAAIFMYVNDYQRASVVATGTNWSFNPLSVALQYNDVVKFRAQNSGKCMSTTSTPINVSAVQRTLAAPVVSSPIITTSTSISGTSTEPTGTTITVYKTVSGVVTTLGTTTVTSAGTWTLTGVSGLAASNTIHATASESGQTTSASSNIVTVQAKTSYLAPVTGTYSEGGTSISGTTAAPAGTTIHIYVDGYNVGDTVALANGTWTYRGFSSSPLTLYAGAILSATAQVSGQAEGAESTTKIVGCPTVGGTNAVTVTITPICENSTSNVKITGAEDGIVYTLRNSANNTNLSTSRLGLSADLNIPTNALSTSQRIKVLAVKIGRTTCTTLLTNSDSVTVYPLPTNTFTLSATTNPACEGTSNNVIVSTSQVGVKYQLINQSTATNIGSSVSGNGGQIILPTGTMTTTKTYEVVATDTTRPTQCSRSLNSTITITVNPVTVAAAGSNQSLGCGTTSTTLAGNTATVGTGIWSKVSGNGTITTPSSPTSGITGLSSGLSVFKWSITNGSCTSESTVNIRVDCASLYTVRSTLLNEDTLRNNDVMASVTDVDGSITSAVLASGTMPAGLSLNSSNGAITVNDTTLLVPSVYNRNITTTDVLGGTTTQTVAITIIDDQEAVYSIGALKPLNQYAINDVIASVADGNGSIIKAYLVSGSLPAGTALNTSTGVVYVTNPANLVNTSYSFDIITKDVTGGSSRNTVSFNKLTPLPVELISFEAELINNKVQLNWSTASEINNDYFAVERSKDGLHFERIGEVKGNGNSNIILHYNFTDENPLNGISYYRLKQNDYNGAFEYSGIISVRNKAVAAAISDLEIFPNPTTGENVTLVMKNAPKENVTVMIFDALGRKQYNNLYSFDKLNGINKIQLNAFPQLSAGIYTIAVTTEGQTFIKQIMIKK